MKERGKGSVVVKVLAVLIFAAVIIGLLTIKRNNTLKPEGQSASVSEQKQTEEKPTKYFNVSDLIPEEVLSGISMQADISGLTGEDNSSGSNNSSSLTDKNGLPVSGKYSADDFSSSLAAKKGKSQNDKNASAKDDNKSTPTWSTIKAKKVENATYIKGILVVNKTYGLPENYAPGVNSEAKRAFDELASDAADDGLKLWIRSGYRSYSTQENIYNNYVKKDGKAEADRYSARPGHSEHQTGLAFDINSLSQSFENEPEGKWLAKNCWKYGFIIRYPKGKESITGYMYEPWHIRYLGKDTAKAVYESGLTLEEYLGISSKYAD